jgi:hypothetical protein
MTYALIVVKTSLLESSVGYEEKKSFLFGCIVDYRHPWVVSGQ